ncbi:MAG TPA: hypothetical protein VFH01_08195 [Pyrinomonadaceae bacterium]|nr:hypothetical protein [Pyrinomonadaceae bacterium]
MARTKQHVYAIVRIDESDDSSVNLEDMITVKEVVGRSKRRKPKYPG